MGWPLSLKTAITLSLSWVVQTFYMLICIFIHEKLTLRGYMQIVAWPVHFQSEDLNSRRTVQSPSYDAVTLSRFWRWESHFIIILCYIHHCLCLKHNRHLVIMCWITQTVNTMLNFITGLLTFFQNGSNNFWLKSSLLFIWKILLKV